MYVFLRLPLQTRMAAVSQDISLLAAIVNLQFTNRFQMAAVQQVIIIFVLLLLLSLVVLSVNLTNLNQLQTILRLHFQEDSVQLDIRSEAS
jgi:SNF family Na+-dependent transporter